MGYSGHVTDMWGRRFWILDAEVAGGGVTDLRGQWRILAWKLAILPGRFGPWFGRGMQGISVRDRVSEVARPP